MNNVYVVRLWDFQTLVYEDEINATSKKEAHVYATGLMVGYLNCNIDVSKYQVIKRNLSK